ncbi:MAG TPA: FxsA family protein [Gammaproteobacteria bacterium]|nr:FxsA family protein [Gammaproteobacteria bacterium]
MPTPKPSSIVVAMNPLAILFLLFIGVPLVEIYFLIKVGGLVGAIPTVFLVVFTAMLGVLLLRFQGVSTLQRVRDSMARGEVPAVPMLEGALLLVAGALLLTPGFVTDSIGFLLLIPPLRQYLVRAWLRRFIVPPRGPGGPRPPEDRGPRTLEGEFRREDD